MLSGMREDEEGAVIPAAVGSLHCSPGLPIDVLITRGSLGEVGLVPDAAALGAGPPLRSAL